MHLDHHLHEIGNAVRDFLSRDSFPGKVRPACLREGLLAYPMRGGKMMRPAILIWSSQMFGGSLDAALPIAAAVELFHTWTLVHDDIIDADDTRRGGPAVHRLIANRYQPHPDAERFGINQAILTGDIQQAWCNTLILNAEQLDPDLRLRIAARLNEWVNPLLISGEALDVEFELREFATISSTEMETMLRYKTALLLQFAAETGAMIGLQTSDTDRPEVSGLGAFAEACGLAFQLQDDLLGMFGDEKKLGKPLGSDLRQGKRTFLFATALEQMHAGDSDRLLELLGDPGIGNAEIREAQGLLTTCGARRMTEEKAREYHKCAIQHLNEFPANEFRTLLNQWADFILERDH